MSEKYLVVLKNPGTSFMVDPSEHDFTEKVECAIFLQEDKNLWIPVSVDSNIAYIMEMSEEDVAEFNHSIEMMRNKLSKPKLTIPGRIN